MEQLCFQLYVGIDVAAHTFSAAWSTNGNKVSPAYEFEQKQKDYKRFLDKLIAIGAPLDSILLILEATGTYWMRLATYCDRAGLKVSVINPRQAYHFARATLRQAKTDALDAQLLAQLGAKLQLEIWQPPSCAWEAMYQRLVERDSLVEMRQMVRNQLHALKQRTQIDPAVKMRKQRLIDTFDHQIKAIDLELERLLAESEWSEQATYLRSIKGIGLISASWLLVVTNGFTTCEDAQQLTSYLGLVPHPNHSGSSRRSYKPTSLHGHTRARRVLYQASVSAASYNPTIKRFYQRLIAEGKHVKVARVAAARKLVHLAFAVATKKQFFNPDYQQYKEQLPALSA